MKKLFLMIIPSIFFISACSEEVKSVDYYKEHTTERMKMLEKCEKKAESLMANSNCRNANKAQASIRRSNIHGGNY